MRSSRSGPNLTFKVEKRAGTEDVNVAAKEVNQLTEWRESTHHPWKAGDPQSRQSRNVLLEGFVAC